MGHDTAGNGARGKAALLRRLVEHVHGHGLPTDLSLRQLAAAVGTTHRMLRYHFDSREGVLTAILNELRLADQAAMRSTAATWGRRDAMLAMWSHFAHPRSRNRLSAFFWILGEAMHDRARYQEFLTSLSTWTEVIRQLGIDEGLDPATADTEARLLNATLRGLGLELLITQDRAAADKAFEAAMDALLPAQPTRAKARA